MTASMIASKSRRVIGLAREDFHDDIRVALRPNDVCELTANQNVVVLVESGAGERLRFRDNDYEVAGGQIVAARELWSESDVIIKYKAPGLAQRQLSTRPQTILAIMHPEADPELLRWLLDQRHTAFSLEYYSHDDGMRPISRITGKLTGEMAFLYGVFYSQVQHGGSGRLLMGTERATPGRVVVIGHGNVGDAAIHTAVRNGCKVVVAGRTEARAEAYRAACGLPISATRSSGPIFEAAITQADLVIGAILISTFDTPVIVSRHLVERMQPGSVIIDATAGYGSGYIETMPPDLIAPTWVTVAEDVIHIKVDRYPAVIPLTTVEEVSTEFCGALNEFLAKGTEGVLRSALVTHEGRIMNEEVRRHWMHWIANENS